jgi:hypothetical protein
MIEEMKACPPSESAGEVFIPGEIEYRKQVEADKNGVELGRAVAEDLKALFDILILKRALFRALFKCFIGFQALRFGGFQALRLDPVINKSGLFNF